MPAPKPSALKVLEGQRGHRTKDELARQEAEPRPRHVSPEMPTYLGEVGQAKWDELLPELEPTGVLTLVDRDILGRYCRAYERMLDARTHMARRGGTVTRNAAGTAICSPWVSIHDRAWDDMDRAGAQLGIGAVSRTRINVAPAKPERTVLDRIIEANRR
jgi:P27 family predicted phage terminase small subunit